MRRGLVGLAAAAMAVTLIGGVGAAYASAYKTVTVNVDGVTKPVAGLHSTTADVLSAADIKLGPHDQVTPAADAGVVEGQTVTVKRAQPVWVSLNTSSPRKVWVTGASIDQQLDDVAKLAPGASLSLPRTPHSATELPLAAQPMQVSVNVDGAARTIDAGAGAATAVVLAKAGIALGPLDEVVATQNGVGQPVLTVTRVQRGGDTEEQEIPFEVTTTPDERLYQGQEIVETPGVVGIKRITYATTTRNGQTDQRQVLREDVVRQPVTQVVRAGTKPLPRGISAAQMQAGGGTSPAAAKAMAAAILPEFGFGMDQYQCLIDLWEHESGWNYTSTNASSGAYGIPQSLPGTKMAAAGEDWRTNPATQIRWGLGYIRGRYGDPCGAWAAWQVKKWY